MSPGSASAAPWGRLRGASIAFGLAIIVQLLAVGAAWGVARYGAGDAAQALLEGAFIAMTVALGVALVALVVMCLFRGLDPLPLWCAMGLIGPALALAALAWSDGPAVGEPAALPSPALLILPLLGLWSASFGLEHGAQLAGRDRIREAVTARSRLALAAFGVSLVAALLAVPVGIPAAVSAGGEVLALAVGLVAALALTLVALRRDGDRGPLTT